MKKLLVLVTALTMIGGAAVAQTTSPANPQQRQGVPGGGATQTPPSQAELQRCQVLPTDAERTRCLNNLRPGAGANQPGMRTEQPGRTNPPAQQTR